MPTPIIKPAIDFNAVRVALVKMVRFYTYLDADHVIMQEPESQNWPRPSLPYVGIKITTPSAKTGDDDKRNVPDGAGNPTTTWNSGGVRKMTVTFDCYGRTHEDAYNYGATIQSALDLEDVQEFLRRSGIAVWIIGTLADLSQLLNTGFEGRAHLDCTFGIAANISSNIGEMDSVEVDGAIDTGSGIVNTTTNAP
jgi:hypothetical protein